MSSQFKKKLKIKCVSNALCDALMVVTTPPVRGLPWFLSSLFHKKETWLSLREITDFRTETGRVEG